MEIQLMVIKLHNIKTMVNGKKISLLTQMIGMEMMTIKSMIYKIMINDTNLILNIEILFTSVYHNGNTFNDDNDISSGCSNISFGKKLQSCFYICLNKDSNVMLSMVLPNNIFCYGIPNSNINSSSKFSYQFFLLSAVLQ